MAVNITGKLNGKTTTAHHYYMGSMIGTPARVDKTSNNTYRLEIIQDFINDTSVNTLILCDDQMLNCKIVSGSATINKFSSDEYEAYHRESITLDVTVSDNTTWISVSPPNAVVSGSSQDVIFNGISAETYWFRWELAEAYSTCGAPTAPTLDTTLSRKPARLSWGAGSNGTNNTVTGYDVQRRASTDGSSWGSWEDVPESPVTATKINVSPPDTAGSYYQFRVRTRGSAGVNYFSGWVTGEAGETTLRCDHEPLAGFTDDPLTAGSSPVKALHMQELQSRVSTLRTFYGLGAYSFTTITAGVTSLAGWTTHVNQVRAAIEDVCSASGKTHENWISFSTNCPRADVIQQLRSIILAL